MEGHLRNFCALAGAVPYVNGHFGLHNYLLYTHHHHPLILPLHGATLHLATSMPFPLPTQRDERGGSGRDPIGSGREACAFDQKPHGPSGCGASVLVPLSATPTLPPLALPTPHKATASLRRPQGPVNERDFDSKRRRPNRSRRARTNLPSDWRAGGGEVHDEAQPRQAGQALGVLWGRHGRRLARPCVVIPSRLPCGGADGRRRLCTAPVAILIRFGVGLDLLICTILTIAGYFPGHGGCPLSLACADTSIPLSSVTHSVQLLLSGKPRLSSSVATTMG